MDQFDRLNPHIGQTSRVAVWKKNKATLWYYPAKKKTYRVPLFLVYSLLNKAYILDLAPGMSMVEAFTKQGYDVYLLDFGVPGYEDGHLTLDDYVLKYIKQAVKRALAHSRAEEMSVIGYCLGGTLALMYTALSTEPIRNLILFAPPLDFDKPPFLEKWAEALKKEEISFDEVIDQYGLIPAKLVEIAMRTMTKPFTFTNTWSPAFQSHAKRSKKAELVSKWVKEHIPFSGAALKQLMNELGKKNKLILNELYLGGEHVNLRNVTADLLVVSTTDDLIVPEHLTKPLMKMIGSEDRTYKRVKGGHISLALSGEIPDFLESWLEERSDRI
ncbi:alpha/beta fold hydrolase [Alkalihalophilus pseudofirmus]|uniref:alpha/beta fold hydrolase n=1 Tax=Alkalihalophilus pseudofirmus TaxID=79885 RepID=UPI00259B8ED0|nr:alpha/beta fold hydrolase [Alkalihalophilus pseudofirmus]WEG16890.1 alpha/beta fold hydrolase [Alkalihalophilus pseudofirmus]